MMRQKNEAEVRLHKFLAALPKARLVAFVEELASSLEDVSPRLEMLMAEGSTPQAVRTAQEQISILRHSRKHYWGFDGADELSSRLQGIIELVERTILPASKSESLALAASLIELDGTIFEQADDSYGHLGGAIDRASALFGAAAKGCPSASVLPLLLQLWDKNQYGARGTLLAHVVPNLDKSSQTELISVIKRRISKRKAERPYTDILALKEIADALGDPELYEEACSTDGQPPQGIFGLKVAQRYLRAGRAHEAMTRMPAKAQDCGGYAHEWETTRIDILRALGRTNDLREALWQQFQAFPSTEAMGKWLACTPEGNDSDLKAKARSEVLLPKHAPWIQARYFLDLNQRDEAAKCILARHAECDGDFYYQLAPLAELLSSSHPLASTALYRSMLEANLKKALSKYYSHGVRYWHALEALAPQIEHWEPLTLHQEYIARLKTTHVRKTAFWALLSGGPNA